MAGDGDGDRAAAAAAAAALPPLPLALALAAVSTVIASATWVVRRTNRPPDASAIRSCTLVSASSRPRPMTTRWSAVSASSLIRWLETKTVRPCRRQPAQQAADPVDALGVEAVDRFVEHEDRCVAEQRRGDAEALLHAEREAARSAPRRVARADQFEHLVDPVAGRPLDCASHSRWSRARRSGCMRRGVEQRRRPGAAVYVACGTDGHRPERCRRPAWSSPRIMRIVVDLPAPFGPTKPVTRPGSTVNDSPSTATVRPYRLRSPRHWMRASPKPAAAPASTRPIPSRAHQSRDEGPAQEPVPASWGEG